MGLVSKNKQPIHKLRYEVGFLKKQLFTRRRVSMVRLTCQGQDRAWPYVIFHCSACGAEEKHAVVFYVALEAADVMSARRRS